MTWVRRRWPARKELTTVVGALLLNDAHARTFCMLSLVTHADPECTSFCQPAKKYDPATTTVAVLSGQP